MMSSMTWMMTGGTPIWESFIWDENHTELWQDFKIGFKPTIWGMIFTTELWQYMMMRIVVYNGLSNHNTTLRI